MTDNKSPDLTVQIGSLTLKNPVLTASGTFGYGQEFEPYIDLNRLGAITVKGTTLYPRMGNAVPRIAETPSGMLNAIGLQNPGVQVFLTDKLPYLRMLQTPAIVNISGDTPEQYEKVAEMLSVEGVAALEINVSCPNVKHGGLQFGSDPQLLAEVVQAVREATEKTLIVKLSPNVTDITQLAMTAEQAGADALSLINTLTGMAIDIRRRRPLLANITGGLSGPAVKPVALRAVWQVYKAVKLPLIGMGGISCWQDAVEFMLAGASAVAVGTANFSNPMITMEIIDGMEKYLHDAGFASANEIIGLAHIN